MKRSELGMRLVIVVPESAHIINSKAKQVPDSHGDHVPVAEQNVPAPPMPLPGPLGGNY
jgi:hypothetical protein